MPMTQETTAAAAPASGSPPRSRRRTRPPPRCGEPDIVIKDCNLCYGDNHVLHDITMDMEDRRVTALIGPSGCGKSTLLRCLNRMNDLIDDVKVTGTIKVKGLDINARTTDVIEVRRRVGMVFQKSNPFPKSIYENVIYGLRIAGINDKATLDEACERSLRGAALWDEVKDRLQESGLGLSGRPDAAPLHRPRDRGGARGPPHGRALLGPRPHRHPEDRGADLQLKEKYTIVIVTHNLQQAARVSDRTAFFWLGRLVEYGLTPDMFTKPKDKLTEDYITGRFG